MRSFVLLLLLLSGIGLIGNNIMVQKHRTAVTELSASNKVAEIVKHFEGFRSKAYQDTGGVWTIGYGHTKGVKAGDVVTKKRATELLMEDVKEAEESVRKNVKAPLSQNEFDSLVSFTFNLGEGNLRDSTLLSKLNRKDYEAVPEELRRWRFDEGRPLKGLTRRRATEATLWNNGNVEFFMNVPPVPKQKPKGMV